MPTPLESKVLAAYKDQNHSEIIALVKDNPELVNMASTLNGFSCSLMFMLIRANRPLDVIKFLVTHPDFDFQFTNKFVSNHCYTNIEEVFLYGRKDVLATIIDKPEILTSGDQITYARAKQILDAAKAKLAEQQTKMPNSPTNATEMERIKEIEQMISMIREATIKYAIANDDPTLLGLLEAAGDDLRADLSDGVSPLHSLTDANTNLDEWFAKYFKRHPVDFSKGRAGLHAFFDSEKKLADLTQKHHERLAEIYEKAADGRQQRMDEINTILGKIR